MFCVNRKNYGSLYKNSDMSKFGERLRKARKDAGLTQTELAVKVGIKQPTLSAIETGESQGTTYLVELANALSVNPSWLAGSSNDMAPLSPSTPPQTLLRIEGLEPAAVDLLMRITVAEKQNAISEEVALFLGAVLRAHQVGVKGEDLSPLRLAVETLSRIQQTKLPPIHQMEERDDGGEFLTDPRVGAAIKDAIPRDTGGSAGHERQAGGHKRKGH